MSFTIKILILE